MRLVVIAIRDITKGEEITVDYSLTEWGDNLVSALLKTQLFSLMLQCFFASAIVQDTIQTNKQIKRIK